MLKAIFTAIITNTALSPYNETRVTADINCYAASPDGKRSMVVDLNKTNPDRFQPSQSLEPPNDRGGALRNAHSGLHDGPLERRKTRTGAVNTWDLRKLAQPHQTRARKQDSITCATLA